MFDGNHFYSDQDLQELFEEEPTSLDKRELVLYQDRIKAHYHREGFVNVQVNIKLHARHEFRHSATTVTVKIEEGPRFKFGEVEVVGLVDTESYVVTREFRFQAGEWYNPELVAKTRSVLVNLGLFKSVQINPVDPPGVNQKREVDLLVSVVEGNAGNVSFGPGYNWTSGAYYVTELSYNNLWGSGRQASFRASVSQERNQKAISSPEDKKGKVFLGRKLSAGYVEPYVGGSPFAGRVSISHKGTADQLWQLSNNFDLALSYDTKEYFLKSRISPFYNYKINKEEASRDQERSLVSTGNSIIGRVGIRYEWDRRNNIAWPSEGGLLELEFSWARPYFGGEFTFFKWHAGYKHYIPLLQNLVWANSLELSAFEGVQRSNDTGGGVLPYTERFQARGVTRVRGFHQTLGPYVTTESGNETTGGTRMTILKSELRVKMGEKWGLGAFADSGNTFLSQDELAKYRNAFNADQTSNFKVRDNVPYTFTELLQNPQYFATKHYLSYGFAFSYITPLGPINAYLSFPWREPETESCRDERVCYQRAREKERWYQRYQFDLNIGTKF